MDINFDKAKWMQDADGTWLMLKAKDRKQAIKFVSGMKDKLYVATLKQHREKRSLDANAYCWVLMSKIAEALRTSKGEIYLEMLRSYGQSGVVSIQDKDKANFERAYPYHDIEGESVLNGKTFTHYKFYVGSSQYNTKEMSVLIDGVVQEAQELEIETATPSELALLKSRWAA